MSRHCIPSISAFPLLVVGRRDRPGVAYKLHRVGSGIGGAQDTISHCPGSSEFPGPLLRFSSSPVLNCRPDWTLDRTSSSRCSEVAWRNKTAPNSFLQACFTTSPHHAVLSVMLRGHPPNQFPTSSSFLFGQSTRSTSLTLGRPHLQILGRALSSPTAHFMLASMWPPGNEVQRYSNRICDLSACMNTSLKPGGWTSSVTGRKQSEYIHKHPVHVQCCCTPFLQFSTFNAQRLASHFLFVHHGCATICPAQQTPLDRQPRTCAKDMSVKNHRDTLALLVIRYGPALHVGAHSSLTVASVL